MNALRTSLFLAPLMLAACGGDDGGGGNSGDAGVTADAAVTVDAPGNTSADAPLQNFDFTCAGNSAPTTATANITLSGKVTRVKQNGIGVAFENVSGAQLTACVAGTNCNGQDKVGMATSATNGDYFIDPIATNDQPQDLYITMTASNSRPTYTYPASPFVADQGNIPGLTFDPALISLLSAFGCPQDDSMNGIIGLAVTDCADQPITDSANITLSVKQNGAEVTTVSVLNLGMLSSQAAGTFLVCNVPENAGATLTEVGGTYGGMALRSHSVKVVKGATTATLLKPGF